MKAIIEDDRPYLGFTLDPDGTLFVFCQDTEQRIRVAPQDVRSMLDLLTNPKRRGAWRFETYDGRVYYTIDPP